MINTDNVHKLELFIVRNSNGQFFRAKGYGGAGKSFVDDINSAKIYGKIGPARSVVTYFANTFPTYPVLEIIKINVAGYEVLDEAARVEKAKAAKLRAIANREKLEAKRRLEAAERAVKVAQEKLNQLKKQ